MRNLHATCVVLDGSGVLITGPSGTGKSTLALALVARAVWSGCHAALVADDRTLLTPANGRLVARAPASIAGLMEVHGIGPQPVVHVPATVLDLVVDLIDEAEAPRFQDGRSEIVPGAWLPFIQLPARSTDIAAQTVFAILEAGLTSKDVGQDAVALRQNDVRGARFGLVK